MVFTPTHAGDAGKTPATCYVCGRHAIGAGVGTEREPKWLCAECVTIADEIRRVKRFDPYELAAVGDAGKVGGAYLDTIGKTDLAELEPEEYRVFCRKVIEGFGASLRRQLVEGAVPF